MSDVRVRFAPSPTGYLHVGGARTALYNYLFAKKHKGTFVLRVEDTDLERSTEESMRMQISDLNWLGLTWDEGPNPETLVDEGEFGPYRQSVRRDQGIYKKYVDQLLAEGKAYRCYHTDEELEAKREKIKAEGHNHIVSDYRDSTDILDKPHTIRLKTERTYNGKDHFILHDLVRGEVRLPLDMVGDFVIMRSNGMPVYNFCCAIDDFEMKISHVFRAEEHLNNTLRQFWVLAALGKEDQLPKYGHMSIILGEDKQKLSKRHGATSCNEYRLQGYLPEALNNFIGLLGWSPGDDKEIMSRTEMIELFETSRLVKSSAVFDEKKLKWMNATHLRAMNDQAYWQSALPLLEQASVRTDREEDWINKAVETFKPAVETLVEFAEALQPLESFVLTDDGKEALAWETSKSVVEKWIELVEAGPASISEDEFSSYQNTVKKDCGVKGKNLFMPLRVCVVGKPHGTDLAKVVPLLGQEELLNRARTCLKEITA